MSQLLGRTTVIGVLDNCGIVYQFSLDISSGDTQ